MVGLCYYSVVCRGLDLNGSRIGSVVEFSRLFGQHCLRSLCLNERLKHSKLFAKPNNTAQAVFIVDPVRTMFGQR